MLLCVKVAVVLSTLASGPQYLDFNLFVWCAHSVTAALGRCIAVYHISGRECHSGNIVAAENLDCK